MHEESKSKMNQNLSMLQTAVCVAAMLHRYYDHTAEASTEPATCIQVLTYEKHSLSQWLDDASKTSSTNRFFSLTSLVDIHRIHNHSAKCKQTTGLWPHSQITNSSKDSVSVKTIIIIILGTGTYQNDVLISASESNWFTQPTYYTVSQKTGHAYYVS